MSSAREKPMSNIQNAITPREIGRLMEIVTNLCARDECSAAEAVDCLARWESEHRRQSLPKRLKLGRFVDRLRKIRMRRNDLMGAPLFRDPAWDMLLDLFASKQRMERVSVSSLCYASGVPATTALRHIERLEAHGMIEREGDSEDARRCWVEATPKAIAGIGTMAALLAEEALASTTVTGGERTSPAHFRK